MNERQHDDLVCTLELAAGRIARAIAADATPCQDAAGETVASLTEAVMGLTAGAFAIAEALDRIADYVSDMAEYAEKRG
jgi:hypothetical protein